MDSNSLRQLLAVAEDNYNNALALFRLKKDADLDPRDRDSLLIDIGSTALEVEDLKEEIMYTEYEEGYICF
jgi:hypothetical protein